MHNNKSIQNKKVKKNEGKSVSFFKTFIISHGSEHYFNMYSSPG